MSKQIHDEGRRESGRKKQIKVRASAELVEEYDEWVESSQHDSRAEALRQAMRRDLGAGSIEKAPLHPPVENETLRIAYLKLCDIANAEGVVRHDIAEQELSTTLGQRIHTINHGVLGKLRARGYLNQRANVYGGRAWKLNGWDA
jgi:hypothetical protein